MSITHLPNASSHISGTCVETEFKSSSRLLVTGSTDGFARLWSTADGNPAAPELPHPNHVVNLGFSSDGRRLVTLHRGNTAMRVWDTATGEAMTPPLRLSGTNWYCRFTGDDSAVITAGEDFVRWPLTDENRSAADLIEEAEFLSAHRQEDIAGQRPLSAEELQVLNKKRRQSQSKTGSDIQ